MKVLCDLRKAKAKQNQISITIILSVTTMSFPYHLCVRYLLRLHDWVTFRQTWVDLSYIHRWSWMWLQKIKNSANQPGEMCRF